MNLTRVGEHRQLERLLNQRGGRHRFRNRGDLREALLGLDRIAHVLERLGHTRQIPRDDCVTFLDMIDHLAEEERELGAPRIAPQEAVRVGGSSEERAREIGS